MCVQGVEGDSHVNRLTACNGKISWDTDLIVGLGRRVHTNFELQFMWSCACV